MVSGHSYADSSTAAPVAAAPAAAASGEAAPPAPVVPVASAPRRRFSLQSKTVLGLLVLLVAAVALCGVVFMRITTSMTHESKRIAVTQLSYALASTLGHTIARAPDEVQWQVDELAKTPELDFVVVTDPQGHVLGQHDGDGMWETYRTQAGIQADQGTPITGAIRAFSAGERSGHGISLPMFIKPPPGSPRHATRLAGYLHVGVCDEVMRSDLHYLQGWVLLTCMAVVLLTLPLAALTARHITVPMQQLATAAHALAGGDRSHRVVLDRGDEVGELARAFNTMADTVQAQQEDIRQINAGLEAKVIERTAELEKLNARLQAEIAEKEDFIRAVSHDLNAPLRNIAGMASMLLIKYQSSLEQDAVSRLERIQKNVEVECGLLNELLELSRIKSRREKIEWVDLHELAVAVGEQFTSDLETKGISLKLLDHLPHMSCERARLRQVFQNLIDNGIKYMRPEGPREIRIGLKRDAEGAEPGEVVVFVQDTGMGIAREDLPLLFHVFRRAKNAATMKIPGKGVGLASVKSIIENYQGRLWVQSVPGEGTTFYIAIPDRHFQQPTKATKTHNEVSV